MSLIDRFIGHEGDPKYYLKDKSVHQLQCLGFNQKEAEQLAWLEGRSNRGFYYGLFGGAAALYFLNPMIKRASETLPYLKFQPHLQFLLKGSTLLLFIQGGYWWTTSKRHSGNFWFSNLYSNNNYTKSKESFLRNFEVMNRPFTEAEIEQFSENRVRERPGQDRRWIYNKHLHGDDEKAFRENIEKYFKNKEKLDAGEKLVQKAYKIVDDVDRTGEKYGIQQTPVALKGPWHQIE